MYGTPGTGKTLLSKAFTSILPPLNFEETLEVTSIYSIAGTLRENLSNNPPFRSPHHSASFVSLVGGGVIPKPGEITLSHKRVLFMDEFPEFERGVINSLREPLEEKFISVSRAKASVRFPANFILIAAMNPCPCGNYGSPNKECVCMPVDLIKYNKKISGPIADRIDIWLPVESVDYNKLSEKDVIDNSKEIREEILKARKIQENRIKKVNKNIKLNSEIGVRDLYKIIKISRTIADLDCSEKIKGGHVLEALQYRSKSSYFVN